MYSCLLNLTRAVALLRRDYAVANECSLSKGRAEGVTRRWRKGRNKESDDDDYGDRHSSDEDDENGDDNND